MLYSHCRTLFKNKLTVIKTTKNLNFIDKNKLISKKKMVLEI